MDISRSDLRDLLGVPLERARTLPVTGTPIPPTTSVSWRRSSARGWVGAGCADDVAAPGSYG